MICFVHAQDLPKRFAEAQRPGNIAADRWAKEWAQKNAKGDRYIFERDGGGFAQVIFKTSGGQWYVTPRGERAPAA